MAVAVELPVAPVGPLKEAVAVAPAEGPSPVETPVQTQQTEPAVQARSEPVLVPASQDRQEMEEAEEGDPVPEPQVETAEQEEAIVLLGAMGKPEITSETEVEAPALAQVQEVIMVAEALDLPGE